MGFHDRECAILPAESDQRGSRGDFVHFYRLGAGMQLIEDRFRFGALA